jgi:SAM-dependent methyltransferase
MTPLEDRARRRYQGRSGQKYHKFKRAIPEESFLWIARLRADKIAPYVHPTDVVLEYGVGLGWNLAALQCARRIGFDIGEFLGTMVRSRGIEFIGDSKLLPQGTIDVVICHHTLEHVWQPVDVLVEIQAMLKQGGRLLLFVPYEKQRRYRRFRPDELNHHLYSWNVQTLGNLVSEAGFEVQNASLGRFGQERFAAIWASRLRLGEKGFRALRWLANSLKYEMEVRIAATKGTESQEAPGST